MNSSSIDSQSKQTLRIPFVALILVACTFATPPTALADGAPPQEFLNRLRDGKFFDMALEFLDRSKSASGIDPDFKSSIELERAQTYIDKAFASRSTKDRDQAFEDAEESLKQFLAAGDHPRQSEGRLRLGKIQMIRAAQYMNGEPDAEKQKNARKTYTRASETFGQIVEDLRTKLKAMQGAKIDPAKEPEKVKLRDQYKGEFLEAMMNAGEAGLMAADTFDKPNDGKKKLLESALVRFTDLSDKYGDYVQGAIALYKRGRIQEQLGTADKALDSYLQMMDTVDAPELRDAKFMATSGMVRLGLSAKPNKPDEAINKGEALLKTVRPNERKLPGVGELQTEVAVAYLAKSNLKDAKGPDKKKAKSEARQWLVKASKIPGAHLPRVEKILKDFGIDASEEETPLPTAEEPENFEQAFTGAQQLYEVIVSVQQARDGLKDEPANEKRREEMQKNISESRSIAIILLRRGLTKINKETDNNLINEARNLLTYLLYQSSHYYDSIVMGTSLSKQAPGTENGLRGGLFALNSMQMLLREDPSNQTLVSRLNNHAEYLTTTWPNDPQAAGAKNAMVALALENREWEKARSLIGELEGVNKAKSQRVLGNMLWVEANDLRRNEKLDEANQLMEDSRKDLTDGLSGVAGALADAKVMREAFVLSRVELRMDNPVGALAALDNEKYGASMLAEKLGVADDNFASQLYSHELQTVVQGMTADGADVDGLMTRASETMDQLRESVTKSAGDNGSKKLATIYLQLAQSIRKQLDDANPAKKAKLTEAFRVFLERVAKTSKDDETLMWIGQTLIQLAESSLAPNQAKVAGPAAQQLKTAIDTFGKVSKERQATPGFIYQQAQAERLLGDYGKAIKTYTTLLTKKPMMIDAQMEAAETYELWAATLKPNYAAKSYIRAINGAKPDAKGKNIIWGWGRISQLTNGREEFREEFFDSRYHLALCRFLAGKVSKDSALMKKSVTDITKIAALFPDMGGKDQRAKFDALLKRIQKEIGVKVTGLEPKKK